MQLDLFSEIKNDKQKLSYRNRKFKCRDCKATRIWLHNWAVNCGYCDGNFIADYQRGKDLRAVLSFYSTKI